MYQKRGEDMRAIKKIAVDECVNILAPGEAVMADRGFIVREEVQAHGCKVYISTF